MSEAKGNGSALVLQVAEAKAFRGRLRDLGKKSVVLDHVTPQAVPFAVALVAAGLGRALGPPSAAAAGGPAALPQSKTRKARRLWVLCADVRQQDLVQAELAVWAVDSLYLPRLSQAVEGGLPDPDVLAERAAVLSRWGGEGGGVLVLCADSLLEPAPALDQLRQQERALKTGDRVDVESLLVDLEAAGYERVPVVTERGQFARRGGIVDVWAVLGEEPLRLEFFDEELESLRVFDVHTQASVKRLERAGLLLGEAESENDSTVLIQDHWRKGDLVLQLREAGGETMSLPVNALILPGARSAEGAEDDSTAIYENPLGVFDASDFVLHEARRKQFAAQVREWDAAGWRVVLFFHNEAERERFDELIASSAESSLKKVERALGVLYRGFTVPGAKLAVLTGAELFGRHQTVRRVRGSKLDDPESLRKARDLLRELNERDLVVHADHGLARYLGIQTRRAGGRSEEVLVLEYADDAKLFVPVAQAHLVSRYVGVGGKAPALSKLGGASWQRTRRQAERSVEEFAAKMLGVAAERQHLTGHAHEPDTKWQVEFEQSFLYRETPDQLRCVEEIKRDMESQKPMDRLLCADVGFGKTEVAIRAAFKAVMGGKQVAILVPTTVLARQHYHTIRERMSEFPVTVEMLSRLTPSHREPEILKGLCTGEVDIVVGTHRLISKDVRYKDLGLVVIDEEQRFGVKHKEKFKDLFRLVDVLTLSATPIPRTLYLALMGMRDMSTIETPPPSKQAVQTVVCPYDERVIRDAIQAELERGGQVFFLHNRVQSIELMASKIQLLCPGARVVIGHGQMAEGMLETVMHRFVEGEADVLVATTIIESGVDIPNANTILIDRADRFGLADLYQLRGRVGRAGGHAFAYLLLPRDFVEGGIARKRVNAIKQYTGLGSGFKIALRDLEIRGAGNLLGTEQSGHIAAVGFDLYCQMLKQAVGKMQGRRVPRPVEVALRADFLVMNEALMLDAPDGVTPAFLPSSFIEDAKLRIQAYRALGEVMTRKELDELEGQWRDQFGGKLPHAVQNLLACAALRLAAAHNGVSEIEIKDRKLMLTRNGKYVQIDGKFPRLKEKAGHKMLAEALLMVRSL